MVFLPNKSCSTNLLETLDIISKALAQGFPVDVIYLDFAKAFDKVSHRKLLHKLRCYGFGEILIGWIREFLTGRLQRVVLGEASSNWVVVDSGVPQGSVLGPLLFIVCINDMLESISNSCEAYADDTKILAIIKNFLSNLQLQSDVDKVCNWCKDWSTQLNAEKCKVVHFGNCNTEFAYTIDSKDLKKSNCEKDLGIYIQSDLKWDTQVKSCTSKANRMLGVIRKAFKYPSKEIIKMLYSSLVRPHLEYAINSWWPYLEKDINEMEKIQRRAAKLIPELRNLEYHQRLVNLELSDLKTRRGRGDMIQVFKLINNLEAVNLTNGLNFSLNSRPESRRYNLRRHSQVLTREQVKSCLPRFNFFTNRVVNDWNKLPEEVITAKTLNGFKAKLDVWMKKQYEATGIAQ